MGRKISEEQIQIARMYKDRKVSAREFCRLHGVKYYTLRYWLKKLAAEKEQEGSFVPIEIFEKKRPGWLEIRNGKGIELVFHEPVSVDFIKAILD